MQPTDISRFLARAAVAAALALPAASCSIFNRDAPQGATYFLMPQKSAPAEGDRLGSIVVGRYSAMPPFDGRMFLFRMPDQSWRNDPYNGFIADPADMLCDLTARAFEESGRFSNVVIEGAVVRVELGAEGVLEQFFADCSDRANPAAVVRLRVYIVDRRGPRSELVAQAVGHARTPVKGDGAGAVADAFAVAVGEALAQVVTQLPKGMPEPPKSAK